MFAELHGLGLNLLTTGATLLALRLAPTASPLQGKLHLKILKHLDVARTNNRNPKTRLHHYHRLLAETLHVLRRLDHTMDVRYQL